jgi:hypothetical protein
MHDQPRLKPQARSDFAAFADGRAARPRVPGTVARGHLKEDAPLHTGKRDGLFVDTLPFPLTRAVLDRGRERYGIFCAPCHGETGSGDGMVVRRGFRRPASFHDPRLREREPVGYLFDAITGGFGAMPDYAAQIPAEDRWAIVAYVRALQLSQHARLEDASPEDQARLAAERRP